MQGIQECKGAAQGDAGNTGEEGSLQGGAAGLRVEHNRLCEQPGDHIVVLPIGRVPLADHDDEAHHGG